jgi:excisionase family DNA binding protein
MADNTGADPESARHATRGPAARHPAETGNLGADLLTVTEVATMLRVSKMTVYRLVHAGTIAALRVGESLRLPRESVEAFLRDAEVADES